MVIRLLDAGLLAGFLALNMSVVSAKDDARAAAISEAIEAMMAQPADAFVIVEVVGTDKFFQYAALVDEGFVFDLPGERGQYPLLLLAGRPRRD